MNKTAIKNFAVWARRKLIAEITYKAGLLGITDKGIAEPLPQSAKGLQFFDIGTKDYTQITGNEIIQRDALVQKIREKEKSLNSSHAALSAAFQAVVEEVAYTWFNRLIAVRFMEVNDYLPSGIRVLSSADTAKQEPDFVTTPFNTDLDFSDYDRDRVMQLKDENKLDELFRMLFIKQCNKLGEILPELFEKTEDYTELLLNISFTDKDGVLYRLTHDIEAEDFEEAVEIIGWLYQYYISEKHEEVVDPLHGKTIKKEDIPAATQLFTTDWVVRYMVDNSLGKFWIERNPSSKLKEKLEFYLEPKDGILEYIDEKVEPKDLTFFDPCMGSGHILVYAFEVLMAIYKECGYSDSDAAISILQYNLHGLDIDDRASQLSYFAVMMKARSYNRRILSMEISPNVCAIQESNGVDTFACDGITKDSKFNKIGEYLIAQFKHAKEIGSLQTIEAGDYNEFLKYLLSCENSGQIDFSRNNWFNTVKPLMVRLTKQGKMMSGKYAVVATNPPYMNKLESHLKDFVTTKYKEYSGDLFSVFIYRNFDLCKSNGYSAFMTPNVWMFIKTYENLRRFIVKSKNITTLIQMAKGAFFKEATVDVCTFVLSNRISAKSGIYIRLDDFKGDMEVQKRKVIAAIAIKNCSYWYETDAEVFSKIPGAPIAYWVSENVISAYDNGKVLGSLAFPKTGMTTGDNNRFLRFWHEIAIDKSCMIATNANEAQLSTKKWFPYCKGGGFRRWYGYNEYLVNWENNGFEIKNNVKDNGLKSASVRSENLYFKKLITWSAVTSGKFSCRIVDKGALFDSGGSSISTRSNSKYILAILNSKIGQFYLDISNATINYQPGDIAGVPILFKEIENIETRADDAIKLSKIDWDSFETSWDFIKHPLILYGYQNDYGLVDYKNANKVPPLQYDEEKGIYEITKGEKKSPNRCLIEDCFNAWSNHCEEQFIHLKNNEEELNRIFIEIYGLQDELTPDVEDKDVTVRKADLGREIRSLISYAVGCMFGRYSLDVEGLAYAGGEWDSNKYSSLIPDADNCIPITDEEYFTDDIAGRLVEFVKVVYGAETLEENLDFIADALGNKGNSSREVIRSYLLNDFYKDHVKTYKKRPIYWLFDSGKENGFKALIYMHRYNEDTIGNLRIEYLHKIQRVYESEIARMQETIDNSADPREVAAAEKRKDKLTRQLKETKDYDAKIAHLALARIKIDLDDGVKVNYEKVQTDADGKVLDVLAKI